MTKEELQKQVLQKYLDSFPCKQCIKFKRYENELNGLSKYSGGYTGGNDKAGIQSLMHTAYLEHIEKNHLPSNEEWEVLKK